MRIVVADSQRVFVEAVSSLLKRAGHDVVDASTDADAVAWVTATEQVDACLVDASLLGEALPAAVAALTERAPRTAFVLLAGSSGADLAAGLAAGAHGAALKSDDFVEILRVLTGAMSGRGAGRGRGGKVLSMAAQGCLAAQRRRPADGTRADFLTHRERETLARLAQGQSTTAIARSMGVRVSTARSHVDAVLTKLGAHSRLEAVAVAVREHLIDLTGPLGGQEPQGSRRSRAVDGLCQHGCLSSTTTACSVRAWRRCSTPRRTSRPQPSAAWIWCPESWPRTGRMS